MFRYSKAQMFYIDFFIAIAIFISGFLVFIFFMNIKADEINYSSNLESETQKISNDVFSVGTPDDWNSSNVKKFGILNEQDKLSIKKLNQFFYMYKNNSINFYDILNNNYNFSFSVLSLNQSIGENYTTVGFRGVCGINNKVISKKNISIGVLTLNSSNFLNIKKEWFKFDIYDNTNISNFFFNIDSFDYIFLDNFNLNLLTQIQTQQLQDKIYSGLTIFINGNLQKSFLEHDFYNIEENLNCSISENDYFQSNFINTNVKTSIKTSNKFLLARFDDEQDKNYKYLVNSNVSWYLPIIDCEKETYFLEFGYNRGEVYYFSDFFNSNFKDTFFDIFYDNINSECIVENIKNTAELKVIQRVIMADKNAMRVVLSVSS